MERGLGKEGIESEAGKDGVHALEQRAGRNDQV